MTDGTFSLTPVGSSVEEAAAHRLAQAEGALAGDVIRGAVRTWLETGDERVVLQWPRGFRARVRPLQILDDDGETIAMGGEWLTVAGGFIRASPESPPGAPSIFALWAVRDRRRA